VPKPEALAGWAREEGLPMPQGAAADPALLKALAGRLNRRLQARPGARPDERLAGVALVEPFTLDNGLLTQTLKQKRDRIAERDAAAIEVIYAR
jgi:long-chain acyl-CoA synthetase